MGTNRTMAILLAFALQLLMVGATAAPLADTSNLIVYSYGACLSSTSSLSKFEN